MDQIPHHILTENQHMWNNTATKKMCFTPPAPHMSYNIEMCGLPPGL